MPRLVALILIEALLLIPMAGGCRNKIEDEADYWAKTDNVTPQRLDKIEKALATKDRPLVRRALLESVALVANEPRLAKAIVEHAPDSALAIRALGNARRESAQVVMRAYGDEPKRSDILLPVLGRMGAEAVEAAPSLRTRLASPGLETKEQVFIKVVLACMGQATANEVNELAQAFAQGRDVEEMTGAMFLIGRNEWVSDTLKVCLLDSATQTANADLQLGALLALQSLGPKIDPAIAETISKDLDLRHRSNGSGPVLGRLAVAALDPARRRKALRTLFGQYQDSWTHRGLGEWPDVCCTAWCNEGLVKEVICLVSDSDPGVARSAAHFLILIGPRAHAATPQLLRQVDAASDADSEDLRELRLAAAQALGMAALPADVPRIRETSQRQGLPPDVKRALEESIRVIELGG